MLTGASNAERKQEVVEHLKELSKFTPTYSEVLDLVEAMTPDMVCQILDRCGGDTKDANEAIEKGVNLCIEHDSQILREIGHDFCFPVLMNRALKELLFLMSTGIAPEEKEVLNSACSVLEKYMAQSYNTVRVNKLVEAIICEFRELNSTLS